LHDYVYVRPDPTVDSPAGLCGCSATVSITNAVSFASCEPEREPHADA